MYRIQEPWTRQDAQRHAKTASRSHEIATASASSRANGTVGLQTDLINAPHRIFTRQEAVNQATREAGIFRLSRSSAIRLRRLPDGRVEEKLLHLGLGGLLSIKRTTIYSVGGGQVSWSGWSMNEPT